MKTRTVTIARNDILFDVDAATHAFSTANWAKDPRKADSLESDSGDATNLSMLQRFKDHRIAELKDRLSRFLTTETSSSATGAIDTSASVVFSFNVEDAFQDELLAPLAKAVQDYISKGVIADWYKTNGDQQFTAYAQDLQPLYDRIVNYLVSRKFPTRV